VLMAFVLLLGWFAGLDAAAPGMEGDKALAVEVARFFGFVMLVVPLVPFAAVGLLAAAMRATRRFGMVILLSLALFPAGVLLGWHVSRATIPEWRAAGP